MILTKGHLARFNVTGRNSAKVLVRSISFLWKKFLLHKENAYRDKVYHDFDSRSVGKAQGN